MDRGDLSVQDRVLLSTVAARDHEVQVGPGKHRRTKKVVSFSHQTLGERIDVVTNDVEQSIEFAQGNHSRTCIYPLDVFDYLTTFKDFLTIGSMGIFPLLLPE